MEDTLHDQEIHGIYRVSILYIRKINSVLFRLCADELRKNNSLGPKMAILGFCLVSFLFPDKAYAYIYIYIYMKYNFWAQNEKELR